MRPHRSRPNPGVLRPLIDSFDLDLRSAGRAKSTIAGYTHAATQLAGWLLEQDPPVRDWAGCGRTEIRAYVAQLMADGYAAGYANNQYRALQQFFRFLFSEGEIDFNPFTVTRPPKLGEKVVPVLELEQLATLIKDAESKRDFEHRRDAAILRLFAVTGVRLAELALLRLDEVDVRERLALIHGKGNKERRVRFDYAAARAIDRYLRVRGSHPAAHLPALWIGTRRRVGMTPSGVYQMVTRRGERLGIKIHPHMFRHTFTHRWLDAGGAEGDLMELNGWTSPQMLRRYGASARAARAQRAYDRVNLLDGI